MSAGIVPILEKRIPGVNPHDVEGKGLAAHYQSLDKLADRLGVLRLTQLGDAEADDDAPRPWFNPADGLRTVTALLQEFENDAVDFGRDTEMIVDDLRESQKVLAAATRERIRFCFTMLS